MIQKHQLSKFLLKNKSYRQKSARSQKISPYEKVQIQSNSYQRCKKQLEKQLLQLYYSKHHFQISNKESKNYQMLATSQLDLNMQSKATKSKTEISNNSINIVDQIQYDRNRENLHKKCLNNNSQPMIVASKKYQTKFYDYFNIQKLVKPLIHQQLNQYQQNEAEVYQVINHFMKNSADKNINYQQKQIQNNYLFAYSKQNMSFNNQSTMALSKFYKNQPSPQRKIRKIQNNGLSKSDEKSNSKAINSLPKKNIIIKQLKDNDKLTQSLGSKLIHSNQNIKFSPKYHQSTKVVKSQVISKNIVDSIKTFQQQQQILQKVQKSQGLLISKSKQFNQNNKIKRVSINLKNQKLKRQDLDSKNIQNNIQIQDIQQKNGQKNQYTLADQEFTIFDSIKQSKTQNQKQNKQKNYASQLKKTFGIKNQQQLKRQIQMQNSKFQLQKSSLKQKSKVKQDLFTSCQQINFRRASGNFIFKDIQQKNKIKNQQQFANQEQIKDEQHNQGFPIFNYLLQKIDKLKQTQKQLSKQKQKRPDYESNMQKSIKSNHKDIKQNLVIQDSNINIQKPNNDHSSSCSFIDGKQKVTSMQIDKINSLVSETVKRVKVNLSKAQQKQSSCLLQQLASGADQKQLDQNLNKKDLKSVIKQQKFNKIFGNQQIKHQEEDLSNNFFCDKQDDSKQNFNNISHPSTVQKVSERSDSKSDVLYHLQELQGNNSFINKLFPQDNNKQSLMKAQIAIQPNDQMLKMQNNQQIISCQQQTAKKPRQIQINIDELKDAQFSNDAVSFSKFIVSQSKSLSLPSMVSFDVGIQPQNQVNKLQQNKQKTIQGPNFTKNTKVKRIQIQLQQSFQSQDQKDEALKNQSNILNNSQLDLDQLNNYNSDEDQSQQIRNRDDNRQGDLSPVIQEDLQESLFNKKQIINIKSARANQTLQNKNHTQIIQNQMKQLQLEFLKDFGPQKKESQVTTYKIPLQSIQLPDLNIKIKSNTKSNYSIKNDLSDNKFNDLSYSKDAQHSFVQQKSFIEGIKQQIDNLKYKIQSSFISDSSKIFNKSSYSQSKPMIPSEKKILINNNSLYKQNNDRSDSFSTQKIFKSESIITDKVLQNNKTEKNSGKEDIDFDIINAEDEKNQIYSQFRQDIEKLKKKMTFDAKIGLF